MRRLVIALVALAASSVTLAGCTSPPDDASSRSTVTVFAAASLSEVFEQIATDFEADQPGISVRLDFAGSSDLVSRLAEGAAADVLATADETTMQQAITDGTVPGPPSLFASNTLAIAVPAGNPAGISSFADLADPAVRVVVCAPQVPCGAATKKTEAAAGITITPVSEELSVTDVLGKVSSGEADAGLVYVTDIARAGDTVEGIDFDEASTAVNRYPISVTTAADGSDSAAAFVRFVLGDQGRARFAAAGFAAP